MANRSCRGFEVDRRYRFKPGSGMPVTVPSIDMIEIGAGGGSIARVDELGLLKVGPQSAGADPGPASYGRGGTDCCVTDADVVLGILDPKNFLGGDMPWTLSAPGRPRSDSRSNWAFPHWRRHSASSAWSGNPWPPPKSARDGSGCRLPGLPLLAFGGAGPVHACYVAEQLESSQVIYPPMASVLSALGTLVTPVRLDLARGALCRLSAIDWKEVAG